MEKTQYYLNNGESSLICEIPDESSKYLQRKNHLSEFKTDEDKEEARDNLGITDIISKIYQSISDIDLDIAKLVKDVTYSNNALTLTFYDDSTSDPISLADLAIDGMLSNVMYIKEDNIPSIAKSANLKIFQGIIQMDTHVIIFNGILKKQDSLQKK